MMHEEIGPKDIIAILRRRWLLICILAVLGGGAGFAAGRLLPKRYTSKTLVIVQQPEVQPVTPLGTENVNQRLATMQQQILSTARLEPVIRDLRGNSTRRAWLIGGAGASVAAVATYKIGSRPRLVLVGRQRLHRWVLWAPNLIIRGFGGRKAVVAVPESDAP